MIKSQKYGLAKLLRRHFKKAKYFTISNGFKRCIIHLKDDKVINYLSISRIGKEFNIQIQARNRKILNGKYDNFENVIGLLTKGSLKTIEAKFIAEAI